ncbi:hypothetical protein EG327_002070 [Venturia inaequalis]|uniref:Uncharacterized protein n=1 Tax=Venturia inaequalis TaxID=5025 RepID=A0A8H3U280_VENIN|nr:hypothetical protein EG327_002070 [Venturia inaequalis]
MAAFYKVLWELCTDLVAQISVLEDWKHIVDLYYENTFTMTWVSPTRKRATRLRSSTRTRAGEPDDLATIKFGLDKWKGIAVLGYYSQGSRIVTSDEPEEYNYYKAGNRPFKDCIRVFYLSYGEKCLRWNGIYTNCLWSNYAYGFLGNSTRSENPLYSLRSPYYIGAQVQGDGTLDLLANTSEGINE